jgi:hypothetical protein
MVSMRICKALPKPSPSESIYHTRGCEGNAFAEKLSGLSEFRIAESAGRVEISKVPATMLRRSKKFILLLLKGSVIRNSIEFNFPPMNVLKLFATKLIYVLN